MRGDIYRRDITLLNIRTRYMQQLSSEAVTNVQ